MNQQQRQPRSTLFIITLLTIIYTLSTIIPSTIALTQPFAHEQLETNQPLFSWDDTTSEPYQLLIADNDQLINPSLNLTTTTPYYQLGSGQQVINELQPGTWYWQATTRNNTNLTPIIPFTILPPPTLTITTDSKQHDDHSYEVQFTINAPEQATTTATITAPGFNLPFSTQTNPTETFTTFLEPGTYTITATATTPAGITLNYEDTFTLDQITPPTYTITFNVKDINDHPIPDTNITITNDNNHYDAITNHDGKATITAPKGTYTITYYHDHYYDDDYTKRLDNNLTLNTWLVPLNYQPTSTNNEAVTTEEPKDKPQPTITIIAPEHQSIITTLPFRITYNTSQPLTNCKLLVQNKEQQGWIINDAKLNDQTFTITNLTSETYHFKIRCNNHQKIITSPITTYTIKLPPQHVKEAQQLIQQLADARKHLSPENPVATAYAIEQHLKETQEQLTTLDNTYVQQLTEEKEQEATETLNKIQHLINDAQHLIINQTTITTETITSTPPQERLNTFITTLLNQHNITKQKQQQAIKTAILQEQVTYTTKTTLDITRITTLDNHYTYLTTITRTITPYYDDQAPPTLTLYEELPSYFLQQAGIPTVITPEGIINDALKQETLTLTLLRDNPTYTLIFKGNLQTLAKQLNTYLITQQENLTAYIPQQTNTLTGFATNTITTLSNASPLLWIFLAIIIATLILNPFSLITITTTKKRINTLTDTIHTALDHLEQGNHEQAFAHYPAIIKYYEQLPPQHQEQFSFAINQLSTTINNYNLQQAINQAIAKATTITTRQDLITLQQLTRTLINDLKQLPREQRTLFKPSLQQLQQLIQQQRASLLSNQPLPHQPLP